MRRSTRKSDAAVTSDTTPLLLCLFLYICSMSSLSPGYMIPLTFRYYDICQILRNRKTSDLLASPKFETVPVRCQCLFGNHCNKITSMDVKVKKRNQSRHFDSSNSTLLLKCLNVVVAILLIHRWWKEIFLFCINWQKICCRREKYRQEFKTFGSFCQQNPPSSFALRTWLWGGVGVGLPAYGWQISPQHPPDQTHHHHGLLDWAKFFSCSSQTVFLWLLIIYLVSLRDFFVFFLHGGWNKWHCNRTIQHCDSDTTTVLKKVLNYKKVGWLVQRLNKHKTMDKTSPEFFLKKSWRANILSVGSVHVCCYKLFCDI